jgi:diguanylate cyclase
MKKWMQKLAEQLDMEWKKAPSVNGSSAFHGNVGEELATILFIIDTYNKNLFEIDSQPVRQARSILDEFSKELLKNDPVKTEKALFRFRQYFASYRLDEYTYIQKSFDDFRGIIWDFVDQLAEDLAYEQGHDLEIQNQLQLLKEAVETNSIDVIKAQSRQFIDSYIEKQTRRDHRKTERIETIRRNLHTVKKKLVEANSTLNVDHLTQAYNRKYFDEYIRNLMNMAAIENKPCCLIALDIDHFKKINDSYGHAFGDAVLVATVKMMNECLRKGTEFIARVGGEEFAILLPETGLEAGIVKAEQILKKIRSETIVQDSYTVKFTISMGIAAFVPGESCDVWVKRADEALYTSKNTGRDKLTIAGSTPNKRSA